MLGKIFTIVFIALAGLMVVTLRQPEVPQATAPESSILAENQTDSLSTTTPNKDKSSVASSTKKIATPTEKIASATARASGTATVPEATSPLATSSPLETLTLQPETVATPVDWNSINQKTREAIVNIFCTSKTGGLFEPLSGSGVIIDPRGVILTNAHVAQYLLLKDYGQKDFLTCMARTGSPAVPAYTLKLLYISPDWVKANYKNITSEKPTGTGENDFALIKIIGATNPNASLPTTFPALKIDTNETLIKMGEQVVLAGYPAGFLGGIAIQRDLYLVSTIVNIGKLYTFHEDGTLDLFSLGGSPVAQQGASGGAAVNATGSLLGIIVTSTDAEETSARDLEAISIAHINRGFASTTGKTLDSLPSLNLTAFSEAFDEQILPGVKKLLYDELNSRSN